MKTRKIQEVVCHLITFHKIKLISHHYPQDPCLRIPKIYILNEENSLFIDLSLQFHGPKIITPKYFVFVLHLNDIYVAPALIYFRHGDYNV